MNRQTLILIGVIALLLIPVGHAISAYTLDKFQEMDNEGLVATTVCWMEVSSPPTPPPTPTPIQTSCDKCKGTKKVKSGDGILEFACPCGANCKCQPAKADPPKIEKRTKQIILITDPKTCSPCKIIDEHVIPALEDKGWEFGKDGHIIVLSLDEAETIGYSTNSIPTFILLENEKEVNRWSGFLNGWGVGHLYEKKTILTTDVVVLNYQKKK